VNTKNYYFYTAGIVEAENKSSEQFKRERLISIFHQIKKVLMEFKDQK
jgi:serine phosphatase RsbU (regulator of sigma subunit)